MRTRASAACCGRCGKKASSSIAAIGRAGLARLNEPHEQALLASISRFPEIIETSALQRAPHAVVHYLRELATDFHAYYNAHQFLVPDAALRNARLVLIQGLRQVVAQRPGTAGRLRAGNNVMSSPVSSGARTLSRDYKHVRRHAPGAPGQGFSGWAGFGLGLAAGLSVALAVHVYHTQPARSATRAGSRHDPGSSVRYGNGRGHGHVDRQHGSDA